MELKSFVLLFSAPSSWVVLLSVYPTLKKHTSYLILLHTMQHKHTHIHTHTHTHTHTYRIDLFHSENGGRSSRTWVILSWKLSDFTNSQDQELINRDDFRRWINRSGEEEVWRHVESHWQEQDGLNKQLCDRLNKHRAVLVKTNKSESLFFYNITSFLEIFYEGKKMPRLARSQNAVSLRRKSTVM